MKTTISTPSLPSSPTQVSLSRRRFLAGAGAIATTLTLVAPSQVRGAAASARLKLGLIGCGGRGSWIANLFRKHGGYEVIAVADYFEDKANAAGDALGVPAAQRYTGLSGYRRILDQDVDAVAIESPPYFHPRQAADAVAAGKHVYLAKPIAVDVPGCQSVAKSGQEATRKQRCFFVDFQTRAHPDYQEVVRRVHAGDIGPLVSGEASYFCDLYFQSMDETYRQSARDAQARLRAWAVDRVLSGDVITEQNIHALDVATWLLDAAPIRAYGTGGRARPFAGDCWDHFALIFWFPNNVLLSFSSKQVGFGYDDILCRVYGQAGTADTHYAGKVTLRSRDDAFVGNTANLYADGAERNIATFYRAVTGGDFSNLTVAPSVRSNLTTILGRTAAYGGTMVTWQEMIQRAEAWEFDTRGLKA